MRRCRYYGVLFCYLVLITWRYFLLNSVFIYLDPEDGNITHEKLFWGSHESSLGDLSRDLYENTMRFLRRSSRDSTGHVSPEIS